MKANPNCIFSAGYTKHFMGSNGLHPAFARIIVRSLLFFCITFILSMPLASALRASEEQNLESHENLDVRWLPLIGSWRLTSNTINTMQTPLKEEYLLTIHPGDDGNSVTIESTRNQAPMFEERIEADGLRHPLDKDGCTGWYSYTWSDNGTRLLFNGESSCADNLSQKISGISLIDTIGDYVDIKLLKSGNEKAVTIRRYLKTDIDIGAPAPLILSKAFKGRIAVGKKFSIDEVIELSNKLEPELLETALVEMNNSFPINSKQLIRLSNANVPSQVVDLMVALSFPEKFTVEKSTPLWVEASPDFTASHNQWPLYPWYRTTSAYFFHGYHYWDWDRYLRFGWYPSNYGFGWYPYDYVVGWYPYNFYGYGYPHSGGSGGNNSGRLVSGQGYISVSPRNSGFQRRYAQPRNAQAANNGSSSSSSAGSSSAATGGGSSVSSTGTGYSAPSASPGGYSGGGIGGTARPN